MREVESRHPAGTIGVLVGSLARYTALFASLERVRAPRGTKLMFIEGIEVSRACNTMVDQMKGDWLWIMGDDHRFEPDILTKLLERNLDIVAPLVCRRQPPFETVLYRKMVADGAPNEKYALADLPAGGLLEVDAAGSAGMLVRQRVFAAMPRPWFEWQRQTSEDVGFCLAARAAGFKVHADLDQTMTHITTCEIEPVRGADGKWRAAANIVGQRAEFSQPEAKISTQLRVAA